MVKSAIGAGADERHLAQEGAGTFPAGLLATVPVMPLLAAVAAALAYCASSGNISVLVSGLVVALVVWPLVALISRGFTSVCDANPKSYDDLLTALAQLDARLGIGADGKPDGSVAAQTGAGAKGIAWREAFAHRSAVGKALAQRDTRWVLGHGYMDVWSRAHRAEEALIECEPIEAATADALMDELRLQGSHLDSAPQLLDKLRIAVLQLCPRVAIYLARQPAGPPPVPGASATPPPSGPAQTTPLDPQVEAEARAALRLVRQTINEYRDELWGSILRARTQLMQTVFGLGLVTCGLIWYAVILGASRTTFAVAVGLYLIGAIVGVFNRLYLESGLDRAVDDYGLTEARLIATPLFSGLAAVGGVLISVMLYNTVLTPTAAPNFDPSHGIVDQIFNLTTYPLDLVIAGIFGLAPSLLIGTLQQQAAKYAGDIKSSGAADHAAHAAT